MQTIAEQLADWYSECVLSYSIRQSLRWTHVRRRKAVELLLRRRHNHSDRILSAETGFSRELIAKERRRLVASGQIQDGFRLGGDGKRYKMNGS